MQKSIILASFSNKLTKCAFIFCAFGRKTQIVGKVLENDEIFDENSLEKGVFLFFIFKKNLLLKIELSEITPVFNSNFFRFRGGGREFPHFHHGYAVEPWHII